MKMRDVLEVKRSDGRWIAFSLGIGHALHFGTRSRRGDGRPYVYACTYVSVCVYCTASSFPSSDLFKRARRYLVNTYISHKFHFVLLDSYTLYSPQAPSPKSINQLQTSQQRLVATASCDARLISQSHI